MSAALLRSVDELLGQADDYLMGLVEALGVEGTNLGDALENVRRVLSQVACVWGSRRVRVRSWCTGSHPVPASDNQRPTNRR